jgi:hypothetical protein
MTTTKYDKYLVNYVIICVLKNEMSVALNVAEQRMENVY